jgi:hypothetical protein
MQVIPKEESTIEVAMSLDDPLLSPDRLLQHLKTGDTAYPWCDTSQAHSAREIVKIKSSQGNIYLSC